MSNFGTTDFNYLCQNNIRPEIFTEAFRIWGSISRISIGQVATTKKFICEIVPLTGSSSSGKYVAGLNASDGKNEYIKVNEQAPEVYWGWVAAHEVGHALGLSHSKIDDAIMYDTANADTTKTYLRGLTGMKPVLHSDDIKAIQAKHGTPYWYKLVNASSQQVLDVKGASKDNNVSIITYSSNDSDNQRWKIVTSGDSYWNIVSKLSDKPIAVKESSKSNEASVIQWDHNRLDDQKWTFEPIISCDKPYFIIRNCKSGHVLDVKDGYVVQRELTYVFSATRSQMWELVKVDK